MKLKTIIAVAAIAFFAACSSTYRATDTGVLISADAQRAFDQQYPTSTHVVWSTYDPTVIILNDWELTGWQTLDESDYVVKFDMDNETYYAWYDSDGTWVGTATVVIDHAALPAYVRSTITMQYPSYAITSVNKEFYRDRTVYEIVLKKEDSKLVVLMDDNGNILKYRSKSL